MSATDVSTTTLTLTFSLAQGLYPREELLLSQPGITGNNQE